MPKRIQMSRQRPWRKDHPDAVIVARPTVWGNPWLIGSPGRFAGEISTYLLPRTLSLEDAAEQYRVWIEGYAIPKDMKPASLTREGRRAMWDHLAARRAVIFDRLHEIRGRNLACWCPLDQPCHADVLLEVANKADR